MAFRGLEFLRVDGFRPIRAAKFSGSVRQENKNICFYIFMVWLQGSVMLTRLINYQPYPSLTGNRFRFLFQQGFFCYEKTDENGRRHSPCNFRP